MNRPVLCSVCGPVAPPTWFTIPTKSLACSFSHATFEMVCPVCVSVSSCSWMPPNCSRLPRRASSVVMYSSSGTVCPLEIGREALHPGQGWFASGPGARAVMFVLPSTMPPVALPYACEVPRRSCALHMLSVSKIVSTPSLASVSDVATFTSNSSSWVTVESGPLWWQYAYNELPVSARLKPAFA